MPSGNYHPSTTTFTLGDLNFGSDLSQLARICLKNIDEATSELEIRGHGAVIAWFAAVAVASKECYAGWEHGVKSAFGRGISDVWKDLEKIFPIHGGPLQHTQQEALEIFVRLSFSPAVRGEPEQLH